jgi:methionyl aminopeptidase
MRKAGVVVAAALQATAVAVRAGTTTSELDAVAAAVIISVNSEIVHGIPGSRVLADGDSVSIDCGAIVDGWHGDSAVTVQVGAGTEALRELSETTRLAMWQGIGAARLGGTVGDVSAAIESYVRAQPTAYGIVEEYTGHGIGSAMHQPPDVPNVGRAGKGPKIVPGMALAIEPMLTAGDPANSVLDDDWTVVTDDGSVACHWEHTMTVTDRGVWVLTSPDGGEAMLGELGVPFGPLAD